MKKDKEKMQEENKQKEEYLKTVLDEFLIDIKDKFSKFDLSNMNKNAQTIHFDVETKIQRPAMYIAEANYVILGSELDDTYTESERKHAIYHELVHMATTKKAGSANAKTGFGFVLGMAISKRIAITEGMTEYMTESITGNEIDIAYLFEKRSAKALYEIFGDDIIQDFFNADETSLYNKAEVYGISKKELKELFKCMDKSLMWRNTSIVNLRKGRKIDTRNNFISDIEQKLVNIATRVCLERGVSKEETIEKIDKITSCFIKPNLKFNIEEKNEEEFLSEYSNDLNKPFEYAKKIKEDILTDKIISSNQLTTGKNSIIDRLKLMLKIKNNRETISLPEMGDKNIITEKTDNDFLTELEGLKNTSNIDIKYNGENKQREQEEKII